MPKKLNERLIKWIRAQRCTGADRGWRYLMVELAQRVEALVEAVEPEDTPIDEQYNNARDARIDQLQKQLASAKAEIEVWERRWKERDKAVERQLANAKAEIKRLHRLTQLLAQERDDAMKALVLCNKVDAEAKAEIERLLKLRQWVGREELNELRADAEVGRLVGNMPKFTRLTRGDLLYKVKRKQGGKWLKVYPEDSYMLWGTAAEALRAIQEEVGDAEDV